MTSMIRNFSFLLVVCAASACTRMPTEYREDYRTPAAVITESNKLNVVATAVIGSPETYVDRATGLSTELIVESEYFSANGRICRRYTERQGPGASRSSRLACNGRDGWVEIPIAAFAG